MKRIIILLALTFVSCKKEQKESGGNLSKTEIPSNYNFYIKKIDGCEYIILQGGYGPSILHKQNCKNHTVIQK